MEVKPLICGDFPARLNALVENAIIIALSAETGEQA
jgi:hypothetical protein